MVVRESDFETGPATFLGANSVGTWTANADGYLSGDPSIGGVSTAWGGDIAFITSDVRAAPGQVLEIQTTLVSGSAGGVVFDQYGDSDYKFVFIDETGQVSIGHQSGNNWAIEATAEMPAQVRGDYNIKVSLVGSTVSVIIDNQSVVSHAYNALTGDGGIGLLSASTNALFESISISTNDPAYLDAITGEALRATGEAADTSGVTLEAGTDLQPLLDAAVARWSNWLGESLPGADALSVWITDLPDDLLGLTVGDVIYVDSDAAGFGWFVDGTPDYDAEFDADGNALVGSHAENGIDLLSVIAHEVGHVLGYDHDTLQVSTLSTGTRLVPAFQEATDDDSRRLPKRFIENESRAANKLLSSYLDNEPLHRNSEIFSEILNSLVEPNRHIVPFNLGMFEAVHQQIPWAFSDSGDVAVTDLHAMIWNDEAGDFEPAQPRQGAAEAAKRFEVFEFLDETGDWRR
jgi:hypothetical protein